jgi:hypothetical protein
MTDCALFIPDLFPCDPAVDLPQLPALELLLARAEPVDAMRCADPAVALFALFGVDIPAAGDVPVAAVTRLGEGGQPDTNVWLRADPVYLQVEGGRLRLLGPELLGIARIEAEALTKEIQHTFAGDGWHIEARRPDRWYLRPGGTPAMHTVPLSRAVGHDVDAMLPTGPDAATWHRALNEIQMLLHASPVNAEREARSQVPVNSVWFWGLGALPLAPRSSWARVWTEDALAVGLARLSNTPCSALSATGGEWLAEVEEAGAHFLVLDDVTAATPRDPESRAARIAALDETWIAPLLGALKRGQVSSLTIYAGDGRGFRVTRRALGRWWCRPKPLRAYC